MTAQEEAYWLKAPYAVLFDLIHLHRVKPWDVNLANLLDELLHEMRGRGFIDFSVSGTAVLTAERMLPASAQMVLRTPEVFEQVDDFLVKIEENIKAFLQRLLAETGPTVKKLSFLTLLGKGDPLEAVRMFIMLLFLAVEGRVGLAQPLEFGDIEIELKNDGSPRFY